MIVSTLTTFDVGGIADFTVNLPGGEAGDLLVVITMSSDSAPATTPAGWAVLANVDSSSSFSYVFAKETSVTTADTLTFTWSDGTFPRSAIVYRIRNHTANWQATGIAGLSTGNLTPNWGNAHNLWIGAIAGKRSDWSVTLPTDYSTLIEVETAPNDANWGHNAIYSAHQYLTSGLEEITWAHTGELDGMRSMLIAIEIAPASNIRRVIVDTDAGSTRDYASLNAAIAGEAADLVALDRQLIIECRASTGVYDTTTVEATSFTGYVVDDTRNIIIEAGAGHEASFKFLPNRYCFSGLGSNTFARPVTIRRIQALKNDGVSTPIGFNTFSGRAYIESCYIDGSTYTIAGSGNASVMGVWNSVQDVTIRNCFFYRGSNGYKCGAVYAHGGNWTIENCSYYSPSDARFYHGVDATVTIRNCVGINPGPLAVFTDADVATNNASSDASAPGANSLTGLTAAQVFADPSTGDLRPAFNAPTLGAGADLSTDFTTDFKGATIKSWPIGAISTSSWFRRAPLAIQSSQVTSLLTDFPLLLTKDTLPAEMFDADGEYSAQNGGGDIRFTSDPAGINQIPCEVVSFITDNDPVNGVAEIWVKVPSVSATVDTIIHVWYNTEGTEAQPSVTDVYGRNAVWADYVAVLHLNSAAYIDSTGNGYNATAVGSPTQMTTEHPWGGTWTDFGGAGNYLTLPTGGALDNSFLSAQAMYKRDGTGGLSALEGIVSNRLQSQDQNWFQLTIFDTGLTGIVSDGVGQNLARMDYNEDTTDVYWGATTSSAIEQKVYHNGVVGNIVDTTIASDNQFTTTLNTTIGDYYIIGTDYWFNGKIGEVRLRLGTLTADWYAAEYNNQSDPATFVIEGTGGSTNTLGEDDATTYTTGAVFNSAGTGMVFHEAIAPISGQISRMGCFFRDGPATLLKMAIYDSTWKLLGYTNAFADTVSDTVSSWLYGYLVSPVSVIEGETYYLGVMGDTGYIHYHTDGVGTQWTANVGQFSVPNSDISGVVAQDGGVFRTAVFGEITTQEGPLVDKIVRGTFNAANTASPHNEQLVSIGDTFDLSRSVVFFTATHATATKPRLQWTVEFLNSSTLIFKREYTASFGGEFTFEYEVVQFAASALARNIISGSIQRTSLTTDVIINPPVDPDRTLLIHYSRTNDNDETWEPTATITTNTVTGDTLRYQQAGAVAPTGTNSICVYYIIEFAESAGVSVQRGITSLDSGGQETTVSINPVDLSRTFWCHTGRSGSSSTFGSPARFAVTGTFDDNTTLRLKRGPGSGPLLNYSWQVVTVPGQVRPYSFAWANGESTKTPTFEAIDPTISTISPMWMQGHGGGYSPVCDNADWNAIRHTAKLNATSIDIARYNSTNYCPTEVYEFNGWVVEWSRQPPSLPVIIESKAATTNPGIARITHDSIPVDGEVLLTFLSWVVPEPTGSVLTIAPGFTLLHEELGSATATITSKVYYKVANNEASAIYDWTVDAARVTVQQYRISNCGIPVLLGSNSSGDTQVNTIDINNGPAAIPENNTVFAFFAAHFDITGTSWTDSFLDNTDPLIDHRTGVGIREYSTSGTAQPVATTNETRWLRSTMIRVPFGTIQLGLQITNVTDGVDSIFNVGQTGVTIIGTGFGTQ